MFNVVARCDLLVVEFAPIGGGCRQGVAIAGRECASLRNPAGCKLDSNAETRTRHHCLDPPLDQSVTRALVYVPTFSISPSPLSLVAALYSGLSHKSAAKLVLRPEQELLLMLLSTRKSGRCTRPQL